MYRPVAKRLGRNSHAPLLILKMIHMIRFITKLINWINSVLVKDIPVWLCIAVCAVLVFVFLLNSCASDSDVKNLDDKVLAGRASYLGHNYVFFKSLDGKDFELVHDIDCPCWSKDD